MDITPLMKGLYQIGMGCQIMDDMVDFTSDLERKRHNYLASLVYYGSYTIETDRLQSLVVLRDRQPLQVDVAKDFQNNLRQASAISHQFMESGLSLLFSEKHQSLVTPSIQFLKERIGITHLIPDGNDEV